MSRSLESLRSRYARSLLTEFTIFGLSALLVLSYMLLSRSALIKLPQNRRHYYWIGCSARQQSHYRHHTSPTYLESWATCKTHPLASVAFSPPASTPAIVDNASSRAFLPFSTLSSPSKSAIFTLALFSSPHWLFILCPASFLALM